MIKRERFYAVRNDESENEIRLIIEKAIALSRAIPSAKRIVFLIDYDDSIVWLKKVLGFHKAMEFRIGIKLKNIPAIVKLEYVETYKSHPGDIVVSYFTIPWQLFIMDGDPAIVAILAIAYDYGFVETWSRVTNAIDIITGEADPSYGIPPVPVMIAMQELANVINMATSFNKNQKRLVRNCIRELRVKYRVDKWEIKSYLLKNLNCSMIGAGEVSSIVYEITSSEPS